MTKPKDPLDRLVLRQHKDNHICIFNVHARDVLGEAKIEPLIALINRGIDMGLLERWSDTGEPPGVLKENLVIGLRLTEAGKRRAEELTAKYGAFVTLHTPV